MSDGVTLNPGVGGAVVDTEAPTTRGFAIQRIKFVLGDVDADAGDVASDNPMPIVASSLPLPTGAATAANQASEISLMTAISAASAQPPVGAASFATAQVTVGTAAVSLASARTGAPGTGRVAVTVINGGTVTIFVGPTSGVTTTTGLPIPAGASITINTMSAVFGISGTAGQSVGVLESF